MNTRLACLLSVLLVGAFSSAQAADPVRGADFHVNHGVSCQACHGEDLKNPQEPTIDTCTGCHDVKALVAKTANTKPTNPHTSPHYGDQLDCMNCHVQHAEPVNYCANCHTFEYKVP